MTTEITPHFLSATGTGYTLDPALFSVAGWTECGIGGNSVQVYADPFGHVFLRGRITTGAGAVASVPVAWRPDREHDFFVYSTFTVNFFGLDWQVDDVVAIKANGDVTHTLPLPGGSTGPGVTDLSVCHWRIGG